MQLAIDQLTTVASAPMPFFARTEAAAPHLYFHLVLRMSGEALSDAQEARLKKYIACFVGKSGGSLVAANFAPDRAHLLVGLSQFCALGTFVRELKLFSATFARRKTGAASFGWDEKYEAFTVSLSQIERVCGYIRRQNHLERPESYAASWNRLASQELY